MNSKNIILFITIIFSFAACSEQNTSANSNNKAATDTKKNSENNDTTPILCPVTEVFENVLERTFVSDTFEYHFNKTFDIQTSRNEIKGILVEYKRTNKLFPDNTPDMGIAFFQLNNNCDYIFRFSNPDALSYDGWNNATAQYITIDNYKVRIHLEWGPNISPQHDFLEFSYNEIKTDWELVVVSFNDVDTYKHSILLSNYNLEKTLFDSSIYTQRYTPSNITELVENLKWQIEEMNEYGRDSDPDDRPNNFMIVTKKDAADLVSYLNNSNVQLVNDCAYYLLELRESPDIAIILLEGIIHKFPDQVVAYLNLGDAYSQKHSYYETEAVEAYQKYIELMTNKEIEEQIPERIIQYLTEYEERENN